MSQRLHAAMLDIDSSMHVDQFHRHQHETASDCNDISLPEIIKVRHQCSEASAMEEDEPECGRPEIDNVSSRLPLIPSRLVHEQKKHQHRSPALMAPHSLMPALLDKVRGVACCPLEASSEVAPKEQRQPMPTERFKGLRMLHGCSLCTVCIACGAFAAHFQLF
jgi:hypothetical protein